MKAALLQESGVLTVGDTPDAAHEGWVLVETKSAGICGTELHILDGMLTPPHYPFVIGHEAAGVVKSVPAGSSLKVGDRVAVYNMIGCGSCAWCRSGNEQICLDPVGQLGFTMDGTFSDFLAVPAENLIPIPEGVSFNDAALLSCGGMTAVHAVRLGAVALGDTVIVDGVGGVGLMAIQVAYHAGARVLAIADSDAKAELARAAGASAVLVLDDGGYPAIPEKVLALTGGRGATHFIELVGSADSMLAGLRSLGRRGAFISIGYTGDDLTVNPVELILSELRIFSSVAASRRDLETALVLAGAGRLSTVIDTQYPLGEVQTGLDRLRARAVQGRNVLVWD
ncbi:MAG: alcohol dehydrogenase catalytic domain-containing protein [Acidimicrobiales bacterium]